MSYNEKSRANLVPFKPGHDSRRQIGRKKGSLNRRTVIKSLLNEDLSPDMIFSPTTKEKLKNMREKTYLEAITMTLANQALDGETQASNILLRELRKIEEKEPQETKFDQIKDIKIEVISAREEIERLSAIRSDLECRFGENYEELSGGVA